jgi:TolB protein
MRNAPQTQTLTDRGFGSLLVSALVFLAALLSVVGKAQGQMEVDINRGFFEPLPVAITDFHGELQDEAKTGADIAGVVASNLERSGLFRPLPPKAFIQTLESLSNGPRFGDWRIIGAQALVSGSIRVQSDGRLKVEFRLWDVFGETQMTGLAYYTTAGNWRRVAHIISDAIDGEEIVLTPRFSPTTQEITYMVFRRIGGREVPRVYLYNLNTGQQEVLGRFPGMTFAPRFAPDGNTVILSMAHQGNSEIYTLDLRTRKEMRLTNHPSIDTSPSFAPDGQQIVFNSDRSGRPQLYVMDRGGGNVRRISRGEGSYYSPASSAASSISG